MYSFPSKNLAVGEDITYHYIHIEPTDTHKPYILFIHGFPSFSYDWHHQVDFFSKEGYGIIVPDCLGYGKTSKPVDMQAYNLKKLAGEIVEILKHENVEKVIGVGHDWGSAILSRLANYHPEQFLSYAFLDIGYQPPGPGLNIETVKHTNASLKEHVGFEAFGYFLFFDEPDAAKLLNEHWESALSLFHGSDEELTKKYMGAEGGFRIWLNENKMAPEASYFSTEDKLVQKEVFSPENGGFAGSINYYRAALHGIGEEDAKDLPEENRILRKPTLMITSDNFISKAADMPGQMRPFVPDLTVKHIESGHWIMLEKPNETNSILKEFFEKQLLV